MSGKKNRNNDYWKKRHERDKAEQINRSEDFIRNKQKKLYKEAEKEIQQEIEKLYQKFANAQNITLAEAKQLIRGADFKQVDFEAMVQESLHLMEQLKDKENLPGEVVAAMERQHMMLEKKIAAYTKRGEISYLELRSLEIDKILVNLYDQNQADIYDYLKSEWDDEYYRQIFNTQQYIGFGKDFVRLNEEAINRAILNRYDKRNFSRSLYAHCTNFSEDIRKNLVTGVIRGENLDKMAGRIHKRMGVALSAAKTLVRTETAYVFEQSAMTAYMQCDVEWYEFLATLDGKTSEVCQNLDGKHFKVRDAVPGKNCPPMHPNCRSTTVCWFPDEEEKKAKTTRLAKDGGGRYYEVPADMTYKEWCNKNGIKEYRFVGNGKIIESAKQAVHVREVIAPMSRKVKEALKDVTIKCDSLKGNGYQIDVNTIYLDANAPKKEIEHEIGHAIEVKLFDADRVRDLKKQLVYGMGISDIKVVTGTTSSGKQKEIFVINSPNLVDTYQGRIYADSRQECLDSYGNIDVDKMYEFVSVAYQYYMDHPAVMKKRFPDMYNLVKESIE